MKNKIVFFIVILSLSIFSFSRDSYLKLDKLKTITKNKKDFKKEVSIIKKSKQPKIFIKNQPSNFSGENLQNKEKESSPLIKPELLGMIKSLNYKAVLLKYNEKYFYLKEGETDFPSKIKIIKIKEKKVIIEINNKKLELEVNDE